jgi:hypothetical protein
LVKKLLNLPKKYFFSKFFCFIFGTSKKKRYIKNKTQKFSIMKNLAIHTNRWFRGNEILLSAGYCSVNTMTIDQSKPKENPGLIYDIDIS